MTKYLTNNFSVINLHKKPNTNSEVVTQMLYGESFTVSQRNKKWLKIKMKEDNYKGYIQYKKFSEYLEPSHKINKLNAKIYNSPNIRKKINLLSFCSKIKITDKKHQFYKFAKGWVRKKDVSLITFKEKNYFKKINIFKNIKYKWGGRSFKGIDCSALIQVCLNFNNKYCPRDAKDQVKYFKKNVSLNRIKKNDIIYWKGHVAVALNSKKLIHAYGPMKKTVVMNISETIKRINKTANLKVISIKRLN
tara:strand:- start:371 stop:1114 length:744 start_codon:yes stop_codon:yes gene_type:complete